MKRFWLLRVQAVWAMVSALLMHVLAPALCGGAAAQAKPGHAGGARLDAVLGVVAICGHGQGAATSEEPSRPPTGDGSCVFCLSVCAGAAVAMPAFCDDDLRAVRECHVAADRPSETLAVRWPVTGLGSRGPPGGLA